MTHPPTCGAIATDVTEATLVNAIGRTEANLLDRLVDNEALGVIVDDTKAVATNMQQTTNRTATRVLQKNETPIV